MTHVFSPIFSRIIHCLIRHSLHNAETPELNSMKKDLTNVAASAVQVAFNLNYYFTQPNSDNFQTSIVHVGY